MNLKLTVDEVIAKFTDKEFIKNNINDPLVYFTIMNISAGADLFIIIQELLKERQVLANNYQKLAEAAPVQYIVATEETIERMKKEKGEEDVLQKCRICETNGYSDCKCHKD